MTDKPTAAETKRMVALARTMPTWDEFVVDEYRKDPEWAKYRVASELEEYEETGEIRYLLSTLKDVAVAKGWVWLSRETGLSRPTLYETLNGKTRPRVDTLAKILRALGFRMLFVPVDDAPAPEPKKIDARRKAAKPRTSTPARSKGKKAIA